MRSEGTFTVTQTHSHTHARTHTHLTPNLNRCHWPTLFVKALWPDHRHGTRCNATERRKEHQNWDAGLFQSVHVRECTNERILDLELSYSPLTCTNTPPAAHCSSNLTAVVCVLGKTSCCSVRIPTSVRVHACVCLHIRFDITNVEKMQLPSLKYMFVELKLCSPFDLAILVWHVSRCVGEREESSETR